TLKHYRILSRLGEGGMGIVYRAEDTRLGRTVALKVLPEGLAGDEDRVRRFEREARAASSVNHPGIATLYDFDREAGTTFFTMEYVEGRTLKQLLEPGPMAVEALLDCLSQVAEALAAAHAKGIIHRDLKPENVMAADSGFYKILDFGLARLDLGERVAVQGGTGNTQMETVSANMTQEGKILGTFAYMSPEQAQARPVDARSDLFAFGSLAYELATGTAPFKRGNPIATFHAIVHEEPDPLPAVRPELPVELDRIVTKCLAKDVQDRYQTAADLAADLRVLRRGGSSSGVSRGPLPAIAPPGRWRLRLLWIPAAAAAVVLLGLAAVALWSPRSPDGAAAVAPLEPLPAAATAARGRVVVALFANRSGDPADGWLGEGLPEMLTTDLAQDEALQVISTQRLYDLLQAGGGGEMEDLDGQSITRLARWAGAGIVVRGTIFRPEEGYRIDLQAYDTADGTVVTASRVEGTDVFDLADRLADGLRAGLQVSAKGGAELEDVTTSSPEAYRLYRAGMKHYEALRFREAIPEFRAATRTDPDFPLAELRLATGLLWSGNLDEGRRHLERAAAATGRMPDRDAALARALDLLYAGKGAEGEQALQAIIERHPDDTEPYVWLAWHLAMGADDPMAAINACRRAMDADANDPLAVSAMAALLDSLTLTGEARAIREEFQGRNPDADPVLLESFRLPEPAAG
ncbi:MAG: protein kinase, partial [Acidobacteriota bacterium]